METTHENQKAKITIELESGDRYEFCSYLTMKYLMVRDDFRFPHEDLSNWRGVRLPKPPFFEFSGTSFDNIKVFLKTEK